MQTKSELMLAVLAALAFGASSAFASTQLARGHDDFAPPPACDDHSVDSSCAPIAKNGADDLLLDELDNLGVDAIIARHGADDAAGEDNGDDHGVDFIVG